MEKFKESDVETLKNENKHLRREIWVLRVFAVCVVIILVYNLIVN
jgi:hypothetical protein